MTSFRLGADLATIAGQARMDPSQAEAAEITLPSIHGDNETLEVLARWEGRGESPATEEGQAGEQTGLSPLTAAGASGDTMSDAIKKQTILFVGTVESDGLSLDKILLDSNWQSHGVGNCREAIEFLDQHHVPVALAESELPDGTWRDLLNSMASLSAPPNLIVSSRLADHRLWAEVLNLGGYDVLVTPFEAEEALRVILAARHNWGSTHPRAVRVGGTLVARGCPSARSLPAPEHYP